VKAEFYPYQERAVEFCLSKSYSGLWLSMGLGKSLIALTVVERWLRDEFVASKVLVIAPKAVARNTWPAELAKWDHLKGLTYSLVLGSNKERLEALRAKVDIYIINRENVPWLVAGYKQKWPFDTVVIDELSSFKSSQAKRFRALRSVRPLIKRIIGLTGTPAPNGLQDLWSQIYLLDQGERLGKTVTGYRERYFTQNAYNFKYTLREGSEKLIYDKIQDLCISMTAKDYLDLPETIVRDIPVRLDDITMTKYEKFEKDQVMRLLGAGDITAVNAGVLGNKLLQFASGAIYDEFSQWHALHDFKLDMLEELIEAANGEPVLVAYWYKHDMERIKAKVSVAVVFDGSPGMIKDWNEGKIPVMLAHPMSAQYGLNLQIGGHIMIWFSNTWSYEAYEQFNGRLDRQGQTRNVIINRLVALGTIDEVVLKRQQQKGTGQDALMDAVKILIQKYGVMEKSPG
jgi:SNF2 family DNA or RNA helicase